MRRLALTLIAALALSACGGSGNSGISTRGSTSSTAASTTSTTASTGTLPTGSVTPVSVPPTAATSHLVAVRAARQPGSDRIVFEFEGALPGYSVSYTNRPIVGTSGKEIAVDGAAVLRVRMEHASGVDLTSAAGLRQTYNGPDRIRPSGTVQVAEVVRVEDFEAVLVWVAGVRSRSPFKVTPLTSPSRLVIDVIGS
jgi:hypothetical protein